MVHKSYKFDFKNYILASDMSTYINDVIMNLQKYDPSVEFIFEKNVI